MAREETGERLESLEKYLALIERAYENLAVRESQEEDITRFQKLKKWSKENLVGLSTVGISIAGINTTIMAGRKALVKGGQALGTFGKSVVNVSPGTYSPTKYLTNGVKLGCERNSLFGLKFMGTHAVRSLITLQMVTVKKEIVSFFSVVLIKNE